ncbi:sugar transporter [Paracoccus alkanivorans]|nr:sugar transporter [Paracoccus alkanivorans]
MNDAKLGPASPIREGGAGKQTRDEKQPGPPKALQDPAQQKAASDQQAGRAPSPGRPVPPPARAARMRLRHWRLLASFVVMVAMPIAVLVIYLWSVALDQYSSVAGFTVRKEEGGNTSELIGGLAQIAGSSLSSDSDILYEFIHSQSLVRTIENEVGLIEHYSDYWDEDPVFALWRDPSIEDLEWYWRRIVRVSYDANSGLIEVRVLAFTPEKAQEIAQAIVRQSEDMINRLSEQAREDAMRYARNDLEEVVERLKRAREALTAFRSRTQIVDPEADLQGRMGVMNNLQQQLATALVDYDLLLETTHENDPRLAQGRRRIEVIRERIAQERKSFATRSAEDTPDGEDYPSLIAEYEGLVVDREFTEETYRASLAALDLARANAQRESRYLATYIQPTLAESSEYPRRFTIAGLCGLFLLLSWSVLALVYYSIRDRA